MPKQYERIKESLMKSGQSGDEAQRIAAATYISRGKGKYARSRRAKSLQHGRKRKYQ